MREGDRMSLGELQREQMTDEDKEIALWVSDKMPQLVKDLTKFAASQVWRSCQKTKSRHMVQNVSEY